MPDVKLKDMQGRPVNARDFSSNGKVTVITFWATSCKPCAKQVATIDDVLGEWKQKYNLEVVAVATDNARNVMKVKPFVDDQGWDVQVVLDTNEDLRRAMNASSVPFMVLLDKSGKVAHTHAGYADGDEAALEDKIKSLSGR